MLLISCITNLILWFGQALSGCLLGLKWTDRLHLTTPPQKKKQSLYSTGEVLVDWQQNRKLATVLQKNMVSGVRRGGGRGGD